MSTIFLLNRTRIIFFCGIKRPDREVDHSSPSSALVKNYWSCKSALAICLLDVDSETFNFLICKVC